MYAGNWLKALNFFAPIHTARAVGGSLAAVGRSACSSPASVEGLTDRDDTVYILYQAVMGLLSILRRTPSAHGNPVPDLREIAQS